MIHMISFSKLLCSAFELALAGAISFALGDEKKLKSVQISDQ